MNTYERKVNYVNKFGMKEQWGRNETADSAGGHLGATNLNGFQRVRLDVVLKKLKDGVSLPMSGIHIPAGAMVRVTAATIIKPGVGAASIDVGLKGDTLTDEDGFVGGCPVTDEGEFHQHMDEQATGIGIIVPERTFITVKANGTFTDGRVIFEVEYLASADHKYDIVPEWTEYRKVKVVKA